MESLECKNTKNKLENKIGKLNSGLGIADYRTGELECEKYRIFDIKKKGRNTSEKQHSRHMRHDQKSKISYFGDQQKNTKEWGKKQYLKTYFQNFLKMMDDFKPQIPKALWI